MQCRFPAAHAVEFKGRASFDGRAVAVVSGGLEGVAKAGPRLVGPSLTEDGAMQVVVDDPDLGIGAPYRLEFSIDLIHWTPLGDFQTGVAAGFARDEVPAFDSPRFYRAVRRQ